MNRTILVRISIYWCFIFGQGTLTHAGSQIEFELDIPEIRQRCLTVLREGLQDQDFWPSMHAAEALTQAGHAREVCELLEPRLQTESDDQRRCGLARELVRAGNKEYTSVLVNILRAAEPHGHVHAAESLYKVGWQGDAPELQQAFREGTDLRLRLMAAAALAKHGQGNSKAQSLEFLRTTLRKEQAPELFRIAAWVLSRVGDAGDCNLIRARLADAADDTLTVAFLQHALAALGDPQGEQALLANLQSADPAVRAYAAVFAGELDIRQAIPALVQQLDDPNLDSRIRAAQSLILFISK